MGRVVWPGQDPIGQCLYVHPKSGRGPCRSVVGVAEDAHLQTLDAVDEFTYYLPIAQYPEETIPWEPCSCVSRVTRATSPRPCVEACSR